MSRIFAIRGATIVGAAGPLTNLLIAVVCSIVISVLSYALAVPTDAAIIEILAVGVYFNVLLCIFNLLPIPPLDGSRVLQYFLSGDTLLAYQRFEFYGLLVIFALVFLFPPMQIFLAELIRGATLVVTGPFGTAAIVVGGLHALLGS